MSESSGEAPSHSGEQQVPLNRPPLFVAQLPEDSNGKRKINKVLIANRGEIASRVIQTCRKLNLTSVAVYVEEDSTSRHITDADEAIKLGSIDQKGGNPYLNVELLVQVARSARADAIHPGYGYLSENAEFSDAVKRAGMIFVGPSSEAMLTLGNKRTSKEYLSKNESKVPLIPGYAGSSQDIDDLQKAAESIGYPVMLKASAGGGGRGMRIVYEQSKLKEALQSAQSEAERSFGLGDCIIEKYIEAGKHIEIQIMGDSHGNVVSFWERECSVQRRHQKVIEETPSSFLTDSRRRDMSDVAVSLGKLLGYEGAGTVEFVVDAKDSSFYFLEVNTRLQVEHPITEEVTGFDLVALQFYVAAGGNLTHLREVERIPQIGHSIECRLCAEDPVRGFLPEHGTVRLWRPSEHYTHSRDVRFETAIQNGGRISIHFDSMIAKVVVWAPTRRSAIAKMIKVLASTACAGIRTNQIFLQSCLAHAQFQSPLYTTSFIPDNLTRLLENPYYSKSSNVQSILTLVPGAILRGVDSSTNMSFKYVRKNFRSQPFDAVNLDTEITVTVDPASDPSPMAAAWETTRTTSPGVYEVKLWHLPQNENKSESNGDSNDQSSEDSATRVVTAKYNAISNQLRDSGNTRSQAYTVALRRCQVQAGNGSAIDSWTKVLVEVSIGKTSVVVYAAVDPSYPPAGGVRTVVCHFPILGTWYEYRCYSLLAFAESVRETTAAAVAGGTKSIKAPMPCTVLSVLKKSGENVKAGEVVMVIESMKMEMNTTVSVDGEFHTNLKPGDAVEEGKTLCWVE